MALARSFSALALLVLLAGTTPAKAQSYEILGTRANGMGGAFVAVADDASAVYWNPAALASGAFFSLVLDRLQSRADPDDETAAGSQSATFVALGVPALGISYYRLRATSVAAVPVPADRLDVRRNLDGLGVQVSSLITHHAGVTLVQSLTDTIAVGTTLKLVRGVAASGFVDPAPTDALLDAAEDLVGEAGNQFDADIGVIAVLGTLRAGLALRNVREPEFDVPGGSETLRLERQIRAGVAVGLSSTLLVSADLDLVKSPGPTGPVRNFAAGAEARVARRGFLRGGFRLNTVGDQPLGRTPVGTAGGSYAARESLFIDGQVTFGGDAASRGWGVAARVVF